MNDKVDLMILYKDKIVSGQYLTPLQTRDVPIIKYNAEPGKLYTIIMHDPDAVGGDYIHFLDINIPNNNITNGQILLYYKGPSPPPKSGIHRYIFLLFEQLDRINYQKMSERNMPISKIKTMFNFGEPLASAMFTSKNMSGGKKTRSKKKNRKTRKVSFYLY